MALFERKSANRENSSPTLRDIIEYKNNNNVRSIKLADKGVKINYWNCGTQYMKYEEFIKSVYDSKFEKSKA